MHFVVTDSLIASQFDIPNMQLSINPPKGWITTSDSERAGLASLMTVTSPASKKLGLINLFVDTSNSSGLLICTVEGLRLDTDTAAYFEQLRQTLIVQYGKDSVRSDEFWHETIFIKQIMILSSTSVQLQLFCFLKDQDAIELWYYMPRERYQDLAHKLESSIGSLKHVTQGGN